MTERLNFYDIYGYVLPGLTLVSLVWVPVGLASSSWPSLQWSSAFIALIAAYACGFLVNRLTARLVRISVYHAATGEYRHPSDIVLDPPKEAKKPGPLSEHVRKGVTSGVKNAFGIDLDRKETDRRDFFFLCRRMLQTESPSYAEQFEGLYTFCLTMAAVLLIGGYYFVGWAASALLPTTPAAVILALLAIGFCWSCVDSKYSKWSALALPFGFFLIGAIAAGQTGGQQASLILAAGVACCVLAVPFYGFYRYFSNVFTLTVYRDFYVWTLTSRPPTRAGGEHGEAGTESRTPDGTTKDTSMA